jgi:hypothetical protein
MPQHDSKTYTQIGLAVGHGHAIAVQIGHRGCGETRIAMRFRNNFRSGR